MSLLVVHAADGSTVDLCDPANGIILYEGTAGLRFPPTELFTQRYLSADGSTLVKKAHPPRVVDIVLHLLDDNRVQDKLALVGRALQGPCTLTYDDGTVVRQLTKVMYESGLEGVESTSLENRIVVVTVMALDPFWYSSSVTAQLAFGADIDSDDSGTGSDDAVPSDGGSATPLSVAGDEDASPITTISGPFDSLVVGLAGGQTFELAGVLADGDTIVIDTTSGNRGPRRNGGPIDWSLLTPESRLWELPQGSVVLYAGATGDDAGSLIEVSYSQRWWTP